MLSLALGVAGGLLAYPGRQLGPELQRNGGFEQQREGWTARYYEVDTTISHSGRASLRITDADKIPRAQSASQLLSGAPGPRSYRLTAWLKTQDLGANGRGGVRIGVRAKEGPGEKYCSQGCEFTKVYSGTHDWFQVEIKNILLPDTSNGILIISDAYGEPSGSYWLDDVVLREELPPPVEAQLLIPNYRGILWSDVPDVALFRVKANARGAVTAIVVADDGQGRKFPVQPGEARLDLRPFPGRSFTVTFQLDGKDAYPPFRLVRRPASERQQMTATFSPDGRFLVRGKPTFLLGVYDSGLGYTNSESRWESIFAEGRRLFQLPGLNGYINFWFGGARLSALQSMMNALSRHGVLYWQTANCFGGARYGNGKGFPGTGPDPSYATTLGRHPGLGGWYLADECRPGLAADVQADHLLLQERDPDGVNLGAFNSTALEPWLAATDVVGVDSYPMYGAEPAGGYPFGKVYDGAAAVRAAGGPYRPFWQVIQFFQFTSRGRWPTREELRSMSYAAIVGGANGLFYWSLGTNALAYSCKSSSEWCPLRVESFENLKAVFAELSRLPALAAEELPARLAEVSDPAVKIRVKRGQPGTRFVVLAYNRSAAGRTVSIRLADDQGTAASGTPDGKTIRVYAEGRTVKADGTGTFTDSFRPWGAHVYEVP
jgi:hypothetical protein